MRNKKYIENFRPLSPSKTINFPGNKKDDLSGKKYFGIEIVGFLGASSCRGYWLIKCKCGKYEARTGAQILTISKTYLRFSMCKKCRNKESKSCNSDNKFESYLGAKLIKNIFENKFKKKVDIYKCDVCGGYHIKKLKTGNLLKNKNFGYGINI